jgi:hypothetical protein
LKHDVEEGVVVDIMFMLIMIYMIIFLKLLVGHAFLVLQLSLKHLDICCK